MRVMRWDRLVHHGHQLVGDLDFWQKCDGGRCGMVAPAGACPAGPAAAGQQAQVDWRDLVTKVRSAAIAAHRDR